MAATVPKPAAAQGMVALASVASAIRIGNPLQRIRVASNDLIKCPRFPVINDGNRKTAVSDDRFRGLPEPLAMKNSLSKLVPVTLLIVFLAAMAPPNQAQVP